MARSNLDYVFATVAYADVFEYPLTTDDIFYWSIRRTPRKNLRSLRRVGLVRYGRFVVLRKRQRIIKKFETRKRLSKPKWQIARSVAWYLRFIPTITLVGVTGGLAMNNADRRDDIDLFIITSRRSLWITRLLATLTVDLMGRRRRPDDRSVADKVCLNMFMSEEAMALEERERDLFSAHEVLQMVPLWARGNTYKRFLTENDWAKKYLPAAWKIKKVAYHVHPKVAHWWSRIAVALLCLFEFPATVIQLWYMRKRRTVEVITPGVLRFHPRDARAWIRGEFAKRLKKRNMPLDNIFYAR